MNTRAIKAHDAGWTHVRKAVCRTPQRTMSCSRDTNGMPAGEQTKLRSSPIRANDTASTHPFLPIIDDPRCSDPEIRPRLPSSRSTSNSVVPVARPKPQRCASTSGSDELTAGAPPSESATAPAPAPAPKAAQLAWLTSAEAEVELEVGRCRNDALLSTLERVASLESTVSEMVKAVSSNRAAIDEVASALKLTANGAGKGAEAVARASRDSGGAGDGGTTPCEEVTYVGDEGVEEYRNVYAHCCHEMLWPTSPFGAVRSLVVLSATLLIQGLFLYGFMDTAWLGLFLDQFPAFSAGVRPRARTACGRAHARASSQGAHACALARLSSTQVPVVNFYAPSARVGIADDVVYLNACVVIGAIMLLGIVRAASHTSERLEPPAGHYTCLFGSSCPATALPCSAASDGPLLPSACREQSMREDTVETLLTPHPIAIVVDQDWRTCLRRQPLLLLWRCACAAVLQLAWAARSLLYPSLAGCGAAIALAACERADELVLNSLSIAFVLEASRRRAAAAVSRPSAPARHAHAFVHVG